MNSAPDTVSEQAAFAGFCIYPCSIESITTSEYANSTALRIEAMFEGAKAMTVEGTDDYAWIEYLAETTHAIRMDYVFRIGGDEYADKYWEQRIAQRRRAQEAA